MMLTGFYLKNQMVNKKINFFTCDYCNNALKNYYKPINSERGVKVFQCSQCLLLQSKVLKKYKKVTKGSMSFDADRKSIMYTKSRFQDHYLKLIKKKINFKRISNILDIGSNRGTFIDYIKKNNSKIKIDGYETKKKLINNKIKGVKVLNLKFEKAKLKKNFYDFVYCVHTLEHLESITNSLKKLRVSLKPEGLIFFAVPNINFFSKFNFIELFIDTHFFHFTNKTITNCFHSCGFKTIYKSKNNQNDLIYILKKNNKILRNNVKGGYFDKKNSLDKYKLNLISNRKKFQSLTKKIDLIKKKKNILFWGAGRIFDGITKLSNLKPNKKIHLYDKNLINHFKSRNGFVLLKEKKMRNIYDKNLFLVIICSEADFSEITLEAKKFGFKNIVKYDTLLI